MPAPAHPGVGLKSHTQALLAKLPDASLIWIGDVLTNLLLGFLVSRYVLALPLETSLVIATAFSATSVAVSVTVWDEMHKLNTSNGQLLVDVAELDDLSGVRCSLFCWRSFRYYKVTKRHCCHRLV